MVTQDPIKMKYTSQQLNYFRACYIAFDLIPEGLRTVFKQEWDLLYKATAFGEWKDTPKNGLDFYNGETRSTHRTNARVLATIQEGNTAEWDTFCLFLAKLYSDTIGCTLSTALRRAVDDLRQCRNVIAHTSEAGLTDADFQWFVDRVLNAFTSLGLPVNKIEDIKNQTDFPTAELSALKVQADNLNADVQTKEKERYYLTSELQSKKKEVETLTREINSRVESFCILTFKPSHPIIRRVNDVTKIMKKLDELQNAAFYVRTVVVNGSPNYCWANYLRIETLRRLGFPCHISLAVEELIRTDRLFKHLFTLLSLHAPEPLNEGAAINHVMNMEKCVDEVDEKQIRTSFRKCSLLLYEQEGMSFVYTRLFLMLSKMG